MAVVFVVGFLVVVVDLPPHPPHEQLNSNSVVHKKMLKLLKCCFINLRSSNINHMKRFKFS